MLLGSWQAELRGLACVDAVWHALVRLPTVPKAGEGFWHALVRLPTVKAGEGVGVLASAGADSDAGS